MRFLRRFCSEWHLCLEIWLRVCAVNCRQAPLGWSARLSVASVLTALRQCTPGFWLPIHPLLTSHGRPAALVVELGVPTLASHAQTQSVPVCGLRISQRETHRRTWSTEMTVRLHKESGVQSPPAGDVDRLRWSAVTTWEPRGARWGCMSHGNQEGMMRGSPGVLGTQRTAVDTSVNCLSELRKGAWYMLQILWQEEKAG